MKSRTVLVFHPRNQIRESTAEALMNVDARVVLAADSASFLRGLRRYDPDVVLAPCAGYEEDVAGWLESARDLSPACRVVLLTSPAAEPTDELHAVYDHVSLLEPFPSGKLHSIVALALASAVAPPATVLVVEDSQVNLDLVADILHAKRFRVRRAASAEAGLEMAKELIPDIVLMDIYLPGMSGIEAVVALKSSDITQAVPIVMLSANGSDNNIAEALEAGAIDFIVKPFSPRRLLEKVALVLEKRELLAHA